MNGYFKPISSGHTGASHHAPGGGALSGGPHLHRGLPVDLQDLPLQPHGRGQEAPGVVSRPQSQGQGTEAGPPYAYMK